MSAGFVYVLGHRAWDGNPERGFGPMVKIGFTARDPRVRGAQIRSVSGLLAPCRVEYCHLCDDARAVEQAVHRALKHRRVSSRRELFRVDPVTARATIERVAAGHLAGAPVQVVFKRRRRPRHRPSWQTGRHRLRADIAVAACVAAVVMAALVGGL